MLEQCRGEGAIPVGAVRCLLSGGGRKGDQGVAAARLDARKATAERNAALERHQAALEILRQRIVAAGIQEHEIGRCFRLHQPHDGVEFDRLRGEQEFAFEPGVRGHQIILLVHLQAMARKEEQADIRAIERAREIFDRTGEALLIQIETQLDLEAHFFQRFGEVAGVVARIAQARGVCVSGVSDNQGNAAFGLCALGQQCRR